MAEDNKVIILNDHMTVDDKTEIVMEKPTPDVTEAPAPPEPENVMDPSPEEKEVPDLDGSEDPAEEIKLMETQEDVVDETTLEKVQSLMKIMAEQVQVIQQMWLEQARDLGLKPDDMMKLYDLNNRHRADPPDTLTEEEKQNWDYWNGLNTAEWEDLEPIFGKSHKCYGVDISQTRDRLKTACRDHQQYVQMMQEYRQVHDGYIRLVEEEEAEQIHGLERMIEENPDSPGAEAAKKSVEQYYSLKYLNWIAEPLDEKTIDRIIYAMGDKNKITYYLDRTNIKLKQLGISGQFIPEISKFEDRFLGEEYKTNSQVLLVWFIHYVTFANIQDLPSNKSLDKTKIVCFVHGIDQLIRKTCTADMGEAIMNNVIALEKQFLGKTPQPKE